MGKGHAHVEMGLVSVGVPEAERPLLCIAVTYIIRTNIRIPAAAPADERGHTFCLW